MTKRRKRDKSSNLSVTDNLHPSHSNTSSFINSFDFLFNKYNAILIMIFLVMFSLLSISYFVGISLISASDIENHSSPGPKHLVLNRSPHDDKCFTQGLEIYEGRLYESCGLYRRSRLRIVNPQTGKSIKTYKLPNNYFAEGFTIHRGILYLLTWKSRTMLIFDVTEGQLQFLGMKRYHSHTGQGWGLATDGEFLIMSDGSEYITLFEFPELKFQSSEDRIIEGTKRAPTVAMLKKVREFRVMDPITGGPIKGLNELEYKDGYIYANVWYKDFILRIDMKNKKVVNKFQLSHIYPKNHRAVSADCLNGIAYNRTSDSFLLTGKLWPQYHNVKIDTNQDVL